MKSIVPLIISLVITTGLFAQTKNTVSFTGYLIDTQDKKIKDVTVVVYDGNEKLVTTKTKANKFTTDLHLNKYYTIEFVKDGYVSKRIGISTLADTDDIEPFMFLMEMIEEVEGIDTSVLDFPSALIEYRKGKGRFDFVVDYTRQMKEEQENILLAGGTK